MLNRSIFCILLSCLLITQAYADPLKKPAGDVILTVSGNIQNTNIGDTAQFDVALLESLDVKTIRTETRWHDGMNKFEGPSGKSFVETIGVENPDTTIKVTALNDYSVTMPIRDFLETGLILAMKLNGKYMSVRDKGPLFIIYPFSDNPELESEQFYSRSVWQIKSIHVN